MGKTGRPAAVDGERSLPPTRKWVESAEKAMEARGIKSVTALAALLTPVASQPALREVFNLETQSSVLVDRVSRFLQIPPPVLDASPEAVDYARKLDDIADSDDPAARDAMDAIRKLIDREHRRLPEKK
jgi:hypothetical protein